MRGIKIVLVSSIQKPFFKEAFQFYLHRVQANIPVELFEIKGRGHKNPEVRRNMEGDLILGRINSRDQLLVLHEKGQGFTSKGLARELSKWVEEPGRIPCFVVGGAYGVSEMIRSRADRLISLGFMTLPHELAAVVLMEQIYRGLCINSGHPYHHA